VHVTIEYSTIFYFNLFQVW